MKYIALLDQGEGKGCDYTIHCGRDWWFFDAKDDNDAFAKLRAMMFICPDEQGPNDPGPYTGEKELKSVTLIRIAGSAIVNVEKWYGQNEAAEDARKQALVEPAAYLVRSQNMNIGSERVWDNWRKYVATVDDGKRIAEADYLSQTTKPKTITWTENDGRWHSQDLGFVQYHIEPVIVEEERQ